MTSRAWMERAFWAGGGIAIALAAAYVLFGNQPVAATATDRTKDSIVCTGIIDNEGEGVFVLDTVTGDLKGWVINTRTGKFSTGYAINVLEPMGVRLDSNPQFAMVTGAQTFRATQGQAGAASMVVYITESTTGAVAAFGVPWSNSFRSNPTPKIGTFTLLDKTAFRNQGAIR